MAPNANGMDDHQLLLDERERLIRVESQVAIIGTMAKAIWSLVIVMVIQIGGWIYAYAQLDQKVSSLDLKEVRNNLATALTVLGDHGTEFANIQSELQRLRIKDDDIENHMAQIRQKTDTRTRDRFYKSDGDRLEDRIERLENRIFSK